MITVLPKILKSFCIMHYNCNSINLAFAIIIKWLLYSLSAAPNRTAEQTFMQTVPVRFSVLGKLSAAVVN